MTGREEGRVALECPDAALPTGSSDPKPIFSDPTDTASADNMVTLRVDPAYATVDATFSALQQAGLVSRSPFGWWDLHLPARIEAA